MAGIDFKLGDDSDVQIVNGKFVLLSTIQEAVRQRLQTKYRTFRGEWFLNTQYGIPYRSVGATKGIIGKGYSKKDIDAIFIAETNADPEVIRILNFSSTYDAIQRQYSINPIEVLTSDGPIRLVSPAVSPNDEVTYPVPPEFIVRPDCGKDNIPTDGVFIDGESSSTESLIATQFNYLVLGTLLPYALSGYVDDGYIV